MPKILYTVLENRKFPEEHEKMPIGTPVLYSNTVCVLNFVVRQLSHGDNFMWNMKNANGCSCGCVAILAKALVSLLRTSYKIFTTLFCETTEL